MYSRLLLTLILLVGLISCGGEGSTPEPDPEPVVTDCTPDSFTFTDQTAIPTSEEVTSDAVMVSGVDTDCQIQASTTEGLLVIDGQPTSASGTVTNGQSVAVRLVSSPEPNTPINAVVTIGNIEDTFTVTTEPDDGTDTDTTPDPFNFEDQPNVELSTEVTSNAITVQGVDAPSDISITNGTLLVDGVVSDADTVTQGQSVAVRLTSSDQPSTTVEATVTIGGVADTFSVTTRAEDNGNTPEPDDCEPDPFSFENQENVEREEEVTSNAVEVSGIEGECSISTSAGTLIIDGDESDASTISEGQSVAVQLTASSEYDTSAEATVTIGESSDTFTVTTEEEPDTTQDPNTDYVVRNLNDSGANSLRQAVLDAKDGETIGFAGSLSGKLTLSSEIRIDKNLSIIGSGAERLTLGGGNATRIFIVDKNVSVIISGLTLTEGFAPNIDDAANDGGAVKMLQGSTLNLNDSVVSKSKASDAGGGIFNGGGTLDLDNTKISDNVGEGNGGGIYSLQGSVTLTDSQISNNRATADLADREGDGGGLLSKGAKLTVADSSFTGNTAADDGGAISAITNSSVSLNGLTISGNVAGGAAGGVLVQGAATIKNSDILGNTAALGGGVVNFESTMTIEDSTIASNVALTESGGGIFSQALNNGDDNLTIRRATFSENSAGNDREDYGGGLAAPNGKFSIVESSFISNSAYGDGGALLGNGVIEKSLFALNSVSNDRYSDGSAIFGNSLTIANSTVVGSTGTGAAIQGDQGEVTLQSSTVAYNAGTGVYMFRGKVVISSSIIAANGSDIGNDRYSSVTSLGYNLIGDGTDDNLTNGTRGDIIGSSDFPIDPLLNPLDDNGGPTQTMSLKQDSPAAGHIPANFCAVAEDQRSEPRPGGDGTCNIGAFEAQ